MSAVLSFARPGAASAAPTLAFIADAATAHAVAEALPGVTIREDGIGAAIGALSQAAAPSMLVVDLAGSDDPAAGIRALARLGGDRCRIVAIGAVNDIALYRELREAGAADYLVKPVAPAALAAAVARRSEQPAAAPASRKGPHRLFVCGARGGAGATTVAVNLAWTLSRRDGFRVALIDLDLVLGTVALALDLEPSHGLRDILENPDRIDGLFVAAAAARVSETLTVFAAEEALEKAVIAPAQIEAAVARLFGTLAENTDCIVVDIPRPLAISHPDIFAHADRVALVTELNLAAARDAARIAMLVRDAAPACAVSLLANKCGKRKGEIDTDAFTRGARLSVERSFPWDEKAAAAAANTGQPLGEAARSSSLARALAAAADALVPLPADPARPAWRRMFGKG